jgi:hypothetical protein
MAPETAPATPPALRIAVETPAAHRSDLNFATSAPTGVVSPTTAPGAPEPSSGPTNAFATPAGHGAGQAPGSGGLAATGAAASAAASSSAGSFFAVLLAMAGVGALLFELLRLTAVRRRSAAFIALLERPG